MLSSKKLCHGSYPDVFLATLHYKSVIMEREHPGDQRQEVDLSDRRLPLNKRFREEKENSPRRISGRKSIRFLTKPVVSVELNIFSWEKNWEKIWEKIFLTTDA